MYTRVGNRVKVPGYMYIITLFVVKECTFVDTRDRDRETETETETERQRQRERERERERERNEAVQ